MFVASADGVLKFQERAMRCAFGLGGLIEAGSKREGDQCSPIGSWPLRGIFFRPDRLDAPKTALPITALTPQMGWCDAPDDARYNCPVSLPHPASAERLWREDHVYDILVILGHNDAPVLPGMGSAIFWHLAWPDYRPTEGCVAIALVDMLDALAEAKPGHALEIAPARSGQ